jgi:hypothetical protein
MENQASKLVGKCSPGTLEVKEGVVGGTIHKRPYIDAEFDQTLVDIIQDISIGKGWKGAEVCINNCCTSFNLCGDVRDARDLGLTLNTIPRAT